VNLPENTCCPNAQPFRISAAPRGGCAARLHQTSLNIIQFDDFIEQKVVYGTRVCV
jgi:hypothetical protein